MKGKSSRGVDIRLRLTLVMLSAVIAITALYHAELSMHRLMRRRAAVALPTSKEPMPFAGRA